MSWNPNTEPDLEGYYVKYGTNPDTLLFKIDVGNMTQTVIRELIRGTEYFFRVAAYDTAANISEDSEPASGTP